MSLCQTLGYVTDNFFVMGQTKYVCRPRDRLRGLTAASLICITMADVIPQRLSVQILAKTWNAVHGLLAINYKLIDSPCAAHGRAHLPFARNPALEWTIRYVAIHISSQCGIVVMWLIGSESFSTAYTIHDSLNRRHAANIRAERQGHLKLSVTSR